MADTDDNSVPDPLELRRIAGQIRSDAWELAERWSVVTAASLPASTPRAGEQLTRFGEIPAFLASLAHHLELLSDGASPVAREPSSIGGLSMPADDDLRAAALEHARSRAAAGYDQRDMLAEFVALRRVLWEHFADHGAADRPSFEGERVVNLLLDTVIVEAADQFFAELTDALVRRAERDSLTDLYNRQAFHDKLGRELARARRFGHQLTVVTIDLDAFKQVNDTLGHLAGDAVLRRVASLLTTHTRAQDIVGRLGGDEFAVALVEAGMETARDLIRRLRIHLVPARRQFGLPREFGISFGHACFPGDGDTVEQLLFCADGGLYRHKGSGGGEQMARAGAMPQLGAVRVLVADDDPGLRALCRAALEADGYAVIEAADGNEAVTRALDARPDVLLLDLTMPYLDGWQVLESLAVDEAARDLPVVMMTGSASQENLDRADRAGVLDFIGKPFEPSELVGAVERVLELTDRAVVANGVPENVS